MKYNDKRTITLIAFCLLATPSFATDFSGGISSGDSIQREDRKKINKSFIRQKAGAREKNGTGKVFRADGAGNVVIKKGTDLKNAIILNESKITDTIVISK